jgi:uncharacterized protein with PIN domain
MIPLTHIQFSDDRTLDCQDCGRVLARLTPEQAQRVAEKPYVYVLRCVECRSGHS